MLKKLCVTIASLGLLCNLLLAYPAKDLQGIPLTPPKQVTRIVSIAPSVTQILDKLGLGANIVATDINSPTGTPVPSLRKDVVLIDPFKSNLEEIIALKPNLVIVGSAGADKYASLRKAGITVALIPTANSLQEIKDSITFIGALVYKEKEAAQIVQNFQASLDRYAAIGKTIKNKKTVYFEISPSPSLWSFGSAVYLDEALTLIGAQNIFADQKSWFATVDESVVKKNPAIIFTNSDYGADPVVEIKSRKAWQNISAIKSNSVYVISSKTSSVPNMNVIFAIDSMAKAIYPTEYANIKP